MNDRSGWNILIRKSSMKVGKCSGKRKIMGLGHEPMPVGLRGKSCKKRRRIIWPRCGRWGSARKASSQGN